MTLTTSIESKQAISAARVELEGGVFDELNSMEGDGESLDVDVTAVRMGGQHASAGSVLRGQVEFL